jgi:hypothetical protein
MYHPPHMTHTHVCAIIECVLHAAHEEGLRLHVCHMRRRIHVGLVGLAATRRPQTCRVQVMRTTERVLLNAMCVI